jgi:hypothetical protein
MRAGADADADEDADADADAGRLDADADVPAAGARPASASESESLVCGLTFEAPPLDPARFMWRACGRLAAPPTEPLRPGSGSMRARRDSEQ